MAAASMGLSPRASKVSVSPSRACPERVRVRVRVRARVRVRVRIRVHQVRVRIRQLV